MELYVGLIQGLLLVKQQQLGWVEVEDKTPVVGSSTRNSFMRKWQFRRATKLFFHSNAGVMETGRWC